MECVGRAAVLFWSTLTNYKYEVPALTFEGLDLNMVQNGTVRGPVQGRTTRMTLTKLAQELENSWYNDFWF